MGNHWPGETHQSKEKGWENPLSNTVIISCACNNFQNSNCYLKFHITQVNDQEFLIHCYDGFEKSGLFLCAYKLLQKKQLTRSFDVTWSALSTKEVDHRFIAGPNQMKFLFQLVAWWLMGSDFNPCPTSHRVINLGNGIKLFYPIHLITGTGNFFLL